MVLTGGKRGYAHTGSSPSPDVEADGQGKGLGRNDRDTEAEGHKGQWSGIQGKALQRRRDQTSMYRGAGVHSSRWKTLGKGVDGQGVLRGRGGCGWRRGP